MFFAKHDGSLSCLGGYCHVDIIFVIKADIFSIYITWGFIGHMLQVIQMTIQEEIRKQIVQELKINQGSQCPNVVVCYHSFYHNGVISLVLEYMDRGSLTDIIRQVKTILEPYLAVVCKQVGVFSWFH